MRTALAITAVLCLAAGAFGVDTFTATIVLPSGNQASPEVPLPIEIHGTLTNDSPGNQGLAFVSVDYTMTGPDPIELGTALDFPLPTTAPMQFFVKNLGYDAGWAGTPVGNDVLQSGGAQNTIGNDPSQPPFLDFPSAEFIELNVGHGGQLILEGTITFPAGTTAGTYTLSLENVLANAITLDAVPGSFAIYPVEAATPVAGGPVEIDVVSGIEIIHGAPGVSFASHAFGGYIDSRCDVGTPPLCNVANQIDSVTIVFNTEPFGDAVGGAVTVANFEVTTTGGAVPGVTNVTKVGNKVTVDLDQVIPDREWTTIRATVFSGAGDQIQNLGNLGANDEPDRIDVAMLAGDIDQSKQVLPLDNTRFRQMFVGSFSNPKGVNLDYADINRDGAILPLDNTAWRANYNGWLFQSIVARP